MAPQGTACPDSRQSIAPPSACEHTVQPASPASGITHPRPMSQGAVAASPITQLPGGSARLGIGRRRQRALRDAEHAVEVGPVKARVVHGKPVALLEHDWQSSSGADLADPAETHVAPSAEEKVGPVEQDINRREPARSENGGGLAARAQPYERSEDAAFVQRTAREYWRAAIRGLK